MVRVQHTISLDKSGRTGTGVGGWTDRRVGDFTKDTRSQWFGTPHLDTVVRSKEIWSSATQRDSFQRKLGRLCLDDFRDVTLVILVFSESKE